MADLYSGQMLSAVTDMSYGILAIVPAYYSTTHGRKLVDTSRSPLALLKNPNKFTAVYAGLLSAAVLLIVLVVLLIRKLVKKARRRAA